MARTFNRLRKQVADRRDTSRERWVPLKVEVYETFGDLLELFNFVVQKALAEEGDNPSPATVHLQAAYVEFRQKLEQAVKK